MSERKMGEELEHAEGRIAAALALLSSEAGITFQCRVE